jgi:streptomycin 6-kinase
LREGLRLTISTVFDHHLRLWSLAADGDAIHTHSSHLLPVRRRGVPAMLNIAFEPHEKAAAAVMRWWEGQGAVRVLAWDEDALLLERAEGTRSLAAMARDGRDEEACAILCRAVAGLHEPRDKPLPPQLIPLTEWFAPLEPAAARYGGILVQSAEAARDLLANQQNIVVLHGDVHHDNVLDFGPRGWLAIDPKSLIGDRCFDYANILENPDHAIATDADRFARRIVVIAEEAGLERERLLRWVLAWCGLSAVWFLDDNQSGDAPLAVATLAARALTP